MNCSWPHQKRELKAEKRESSILVLPNEDTNFTTGCLQSCAHIFKDFKSAVDSDALWERFLPPYYYQLIARAVSPVAINYNKQLFRHLSEWEVSSCQTLAPSYQPINENGAW